MVRRGTKRLYLYGSQALAQDVITKYTTKVPAKLGTMAKDYTSGILEYVRTPGKKADAARKLSMWYDSLYEHVDTIVETYGAIRKAYKARLKSVKGVAIPTPPPPIPAPAV